MSDPKQLQSMRNIQSVNDTESAPINTTATKQATDQESLNGATLTSSEEQTNVSVQADSVSDVRTETVEGITFEDKELERWNAVNAFRLKSGETTLAGSRYKKEFGQMDLYELRDALLADEKSKSKLFMAMYDNLDKLLKLSATGGRTIGSDGAEITADFGDTLYEAQRAVHDYLSTRIRQIHVFDNGKKRLDMAERIERLLDDLSENINKTIDALPEKERRMKEYERDGLTPEQIKDKERFLELDAKALDARKVLETGEFGPRLDEETGEKVEATWLAGNFTDKLLELLGNPGKLRTKEEKNDFLAAITDKNNLLLANKMTVTVLTESDTDISMRMPWIREDIKRYVASKLTDEEVLTKQPEEIAEKVRALMSEYAENYKPELEKSRERSERLIKILQVDEATADYKKISVDIYAHKDIENMLVYADDARYNEWLDSLRQKVEADDKEIDEQLSKYYSKPSVKSIRLKLNSHMASLRLFGSTDAILNQTGIFRSQLRFLAPEEYKVERMLKRLMKLGGIPDILKDSFLEHITLGAYDELYKNGYSFWKPIAEEYGKNYKTNDDYFSDKLLGKSLKSRFLAFFGRKSLMVSGDTWDKLEELRLHAGDYKPEEFKEELKKILQDGEQTSGEKITREEYLTKRKFHDEGQKKVRLQHAKREEDRITRIGDSCDDKFLLALADNGANTLTHYRNTDLIYRGSAEFERLKEENRKQLNSQLNTKRREQLGELLREAQVAEDKIEEFTDRFKWMIEGIADTEGGLFEDDRLECERINLERFGVRTWDKALDRIKKYIPSISGGETHEDISKAKERFNKGVDKIKAYGGGKYKEIADILTDIPEIYTTVMSGDAAALDKLFKEKVDPNFTAVTAALPTFKEKEFHGTAVYKQYVYSNLKSIYSGSVSGDADYHAQRMRDFSQRMYSVRINNNLRQAEEALNKKYAESARHKADTEAKKKFKATGDEIVLTGEIKYTLMLLAENTDKYEELLDPEKTVENALKLYESRKANLNKDATFENTLTQKITNTSLGTDPLASKRREYAESKEKGRSARNGFLDLNLNDLHNVKSGKSLVRVEENGRNTVSLNQADVDTVRGELLKQVDFTLPPVLRDAIIEEGASRGIGAVKRFVAFDLNRPMEGNLYRHAHRMNELYQGLLRETGDDPGMSEEEAQMYAVRIYSNKADRQFFDYDVSGTPPVSVSDIRGSEDYKDFRANYRKLKAFESEAQTDPSLKMEQEDMSRNLRLLLITNVGLNRQNDAGRHLRYGDLKSDREKKEFADSIGDVIDAHTAYIKYASKVEQVIRKEVEKLRKDPKWKASVFYQDSEVLSLREYFMSDMIKELKEGKSFNEADWTRKVGDFYKAADNRRALMNEKDSVCAEDLLKQEQERMETGVGKEIISDIIKNSALIFHGRENMYEQLDEDQKKFFAAALMLMDKGSIGNGTLGTEALLTDTDKRKELSDHIGKELQKYIRGEVYHINIDYRDAAYKLLDHQNVGMMSLRKEYVLSKVAFNQALLFAKTIQQKKQSYNKGEKDMDRVRDGYSSIEAAFFRNGNQQKNVIDDLQTEPLTKEDVIAKLIDYAKNDQISARKAVLGAGIAAAGGAVALTGVILSSKDQDKAENKAKEKGKDKDKAEASTGDIVKDNLISTAGLVATATGLRMGDDTIRDKARMSNILKRLEALEKDDEELKLFLRIMQDRTVLDVSTGDSSSHADQEKRDLLFNALTGDQETAGETISGFADNESCHQAFTNALSFQLRDDAYFKGKVISKDHFAKGALSRSSVVDWNLIERAFEFMDEIKDRRATVYVTGHASDLIRETGNKEAIAEYDKLEKEYGKDKEKFDLKAIEDKLAGLKTVSAGYMSGGEEEIERAWSGYLSLSAQEKNLFYKVLQRRDLLDISKKNYVSNYFGISDRNYLNATGRNKLLNEYVQSTLGDGVGVALDKDAYYRAMKSLLSTQVSDITGYQGKEDLSGKVKGIFSYERFGILGRGCAVDWKLFKRALNFVKRAKNEVKTQEGNALLYQGAGDLAENGQIDVDYSFLRRNIHKTGNQWSRLFGRIFVRRVKKETGLDKILDTVASVADTVNDVRKILHISDDGYIGKGIRFLKTGTADFKNFSKSLEGEAQFTAVNVQSKEDYDESQKSEQKRLKEEKAKREAEIKRREELLFYDRIKEGFDNIVAQKKSVEEAVSGMNTFLNQELNVYMAGSLASKSAAGLSKEQGDKNLVTEIVGDKKVSGKGDFRDKLTELNKKGDSIKDIWNTVDNIPFASNLKGLLVYGVEKAVYGKILKDKIIGGDINHDKNGNEIELTRKEEIAALKKNAEDFVKNQVESIFVGIVGQDAANKVLDAEKFIYENKTFISDGVEYFTKGLDYAKQCVEHVKNISKSIDNIRDLKQGAKDASTHRTEDDEKLTKAGEKRLNAKQLEKAKQAADMHRGMGSMADTISEAMQGFNIAQDVINLTIESVNAFGGQFNYPQRLISAAIQDGLEIAMFAMRVCTDRKALQDYFFTTPEGLRTVRNIQTGFKNEKNAGSESARKNADKIERVIRDYSYKTQIKNADMVDIIADAQGYEHTGELVEDVGMSMAQSLVFCASKFNPMMETKLMAITVMSVMGLSAGEIGDTSPEVTKKLFESFKMSR